MKKFNIGVSFVGSIYVQVKAEDEDDAREKAEQIVFSMDDGEFLHDLQPEHNETVIIEEITNGNS